MFSSAIVESIENSEDGFRFYFITVDTFPFNSKPVQINQEPVIWDKPGTCYFCFYNILHA